MYIYICIYICIYRLGFTRRLWYAGGANPAAKPSNLPRGFQRFSFENHFGAGVFSDLG